MLVHIVNKKLGQTPFEALNLLKKKKWINQASKLTYAGRLDPMATGALIILENATQKEKEKIQNLDKVYKAQIILGLTSDSFDLLGIPKKGDIKKVSSEKIKKIIKQLKGKQNFQVPKFSSIPFRGEPLFQLAKRNLIDENELPFRAREIKKIKILRIFKIHSRKLLEYIFSSIKKVKGDFRQEKILNSWANLLKKHKQKFLIIEVIIHCQSGTYIRSLADKIGRIIGTGAVLFKLKRLSVGKYIL